MEQWLAMSPHRDEVLGRVSMLSLCLCGFFSEFTDFILQSKDVQNGVRLTGEIKINSKRCEREIEWFNLAFLPLLTGIGYRPLATLKDKRYR